MYEVVKDIREEKVTELLHRLRKSKIAVIGDVALDIYWRADMRKSELSRETPHFPLPIVEEWMSPGAAGNVATNIMALKPEKLFLLSIIGKDWRGDLFIKEVEKRGIITDFLIRSDERVTNAYCKPLRRGFSDVEYEDPRIDFENFRLITQKEEDELIKLLEKVAKEIDVLCVVDQMRFGCITPRVREKIENFSREGLTVIVDSRERIGYFTDVILKPNDIEMFKAMGIEKDPQKLSIEELLEFAEKFSIQKRSDVCVTLGARGAIYVEKDTSKKYYVPTVNLTPPLDVCGAGDTFLSVFSLVLGTGGKKVEAVFMGNLAASVVVKKIGTTGVATVEEIMDNYKKHWATS